MSFEDLGVHVWMSYEDPRYPTICLRKDGQTVGYDLNLNTLELTRVCVCAAHSSGECLCGAWDVS